MQNIPVARHHSGSNPIYCATNTALLCHDSHGGTLVRLNFGDDDIFTTLHLNSTFYYIHHLLAQASGLVIIVLDGPGSISWMNLCNATSSLRIS